MKKSKNSKTNWQENNSIEDVIGTIAIILLIILFIMFAIVGFGAIVEPDSVQEQIKNEQMIGGW